MLDRRRSQIKQTEAKSTVIEINELNPSSGYLGVLGH